MSDTSACSLNSTHGSLACSGLLSGTPASWRSLPFGYSSVSRCGSNEQDFKWSSDCSCRSWIHFTVSPSSHRNIKSANTNHVTSAHTFHNKTPVQGKTVEATPFKIKPQTDRQYELFSWRPLQISPKELNMLKCENMIQRPPWRSHVASTSICFYYYFYEGTIRAFSNFSLNMSNLVFPAGLLPSVLLTSSGWNREQQFHADIRGHVVPVFHKKCPKKSNKKCLWIFYKETDF